MVRTTIEHVVLVPEGWDTHLINFSRNESSSCADNILHELGRLDDYLHAEDEEERPETRPPCSCGVVESNYVREASSSDEFRSGVYIDEKRAPRSAAEAEAADRARVEGN